MRTSILVAAFTMGATLCAAGCGACEPSSVQGNDGAAASGTGAAVSAKPPPSASAIAHPAPPRLACRAIAVEGDVHLEVPGDAGMVPLLIEGLVPTEGWLDLAKGTKFVAKDPRTTRETTFRGGPGRARACVGYAEESWIAAGGFDSTMGSGESPGQEEWIVTPLAVVRYAAAKVSVDVRPKDARIAVTTGVASAWVGDDARIRDFDGGATAKASPARDETTDGWIRLENASIFLSAAAGSPDTPDAARAALDKCSSLAKIAKDLTSTLMAGGADAAVITQQVTSRRLARAACDVAGLRIAALPPSEGALSLGKSLAEANTAWTTIGP
ncbi:MAG TPA: hypothetical protein VMI75_17710 [Polyangiaceae bacterium]|nr:hypothetical protein [Polyangiaceae bacterium]